MNKEGGQAAVTAAIDKEISDRDRALAIKQADDKVARLTVEQEGK